MCHDEGARSPVKAGLSDGAKACSARVHSTNFRPSLPRASLQVLPNGAFRAGTLLADRLGARVPLMPHALIVDDDTNFQEGLAQVVEREGFTAATATTLADARAELAQRLPGRRPARPQPPGWLRDGAARGALRQRLSGGDPDHRPGARSRPRSRRCAAGRRDYLTKPVDFARVKTVLANLSRTRELKREIGSLRGELRKLGRFGPLIGASEGDAAASTTSCRASPPRTRACWCSARPAPARSWSRRRSTR